MSDLRLLMLDFTLSSKRKAYTFYHYKTSWKEFMSLSNMLPRKFYSSKEAADELLAMLDEDDVDLEIGIS